MFLSSWFFKQFSRLLDPTDGGNTLLRNGLTIDKSAERDSPDDLNFNKSPHKNKN
jgi:hypothetical protein